MAAAMNVGNELIRKVWKEADLKPHRLERYLATKDPDFERKPGVIGRDWAQCGGVSLARSPARSTGFPERQVSFPLPPRLPSPLPRTSVTTSPDILNHSSHSIYLTPSPPALGRLWYKPCPVRNIMTTLRKIESNRANAKRSTGPKTLLGKANSSPQCHHPRHHGHHSPHPHGIGRGPPHPYHLLCRYAPTRQPGRNGPRRRPLSPLPGACAVPGPPKPVSSTPNFSAEAPRIAEQYGKIDHHMRTSLAFKALAEDSTTWVSLDRYETRMRRAFRSALNDLHRLRHRENDDNLPNEAKKPILINTRRP